MEKWKKYGLMGIASAGLIVGAVGNQHCWKIVPYTSPLGIYDVNNDGVDDLIVDIPALQLNYSPIGWIDGNNLSSRMIKGSNGFVLNSKINYVDRMINDNLIPSFPADIGRRDGVAGRGIYINLNDGKDFFLRR